MNRNRQLLLENCQLLHSGVHFCVVFSGNAILKYFWASQRRSDPFLPLLRSSERYNNCIFTQYSSMFFCSSEWPPIYPRLCRRVSLSLAVLQARSEVPRTAHAQRLSLYARQISGTRCFPVSERRVMEWIYLKKRINNF